MRSVSVEGLKKSFGDLKAVDGVTFQVEKGEFFGLLGPNGAGKTTTIRMITGVLRQDEGVIEVEGIDLRRFPLEAKQRMGVIPEVGNVYPDLSAMENLDLVGKFYGMPKSRRRERAESLLADLGLQERKDDYVRKFSKGMKQRVSIACAMIHEPAVLLLDEPTEGLDVMSRRLIVDKVKEMNGRGSTVILTTHNIEEANRLCQRVCIMNKGRIVAIDSPERLRKTAERTQTIEVAFDRAVDIGLLECDAVLRAEPCGDKWRLITHDPDMAIEHLVMIKRREGLRIISLATSGPSLEDVFVKLCEVPR